MKILVTGAFGAIGSRLVPELVRRGHDVCTCDLWHATDEVMFSKGRIGHYVRCDVGEYRQLERMVDAVGAPDIVYHLAAEAGRWSGEDFYENLWRTNAVGTKNIIRLQEHHGFRLVFLSTSEIYGDYDGLMVESLTEERPVFPLNDYGVSKWVGELQVRNSAAQFGTESVVVRPFNVYGPGEHSSPYRSVNSLFLFSALRGEPFVVYKGHSRTSIFIDDLVRTLGNVVENFCVGETYNIAAGHSYTIEELARIALEVTGASPDLVTYLESPEPMTVRAKRPSIEKAERDLGHRVTVSLEEGMSRTADWLRETYGL